LQFKFSATDLQMHAFSLQLTLISNIYGQQQQASQVSHN